MLSSTGPALQFHDNVFGIYDKIKYDYSSTVYKQRDSKWKRYIYQHSNGNWYVSKTTGGYGGTMSTADLKNWKYAVAGRWHDDDKTIRFAPVFSSIQVQTKSKPINTSPIMIRSTTIQTTTIPQTKITSLEAG